jgi:hypothetical protein
LSYNINWHVMPGDPVLSSPQYQKYSQTSFEGLNINEVKTSLKAALASNESASVVNYLSWVIRVMTLVG